MHIAVIVFKEQVTWDAAGRVYVNTITKLYILYVCTFLKDNWNVLQ
jgi:hypothetical protein